MVYSIFEKHNFPPPLLVELMSEKTALKQMTSQIILNAEILLCLIFGTHHCPDINCKATLVWAKFPDMNYKGRFQDLVIVSVQISW